MAEDIIENSLGVLNNGYAFTTNISVPGIIHLVIIANSANLFSGSGMIAQISFQAVGQLGYSSPLTFADAQINSELSLGVAIDGSIELILDELTITGRDNLGIGAEDSIILGMCEGCTDEWKYGEDEDDYPAPPGEYTNIHFYHPEWLDQEDENGNVCNVIDFTEFIEMGDRSNFISIQPNDTFIIKQTAWSYIITEIGTVNTIMSLFNIYLNLK